MKSLLYPPYLQWEVTSECNHNCIHCYNYWRKDNDYFSEVPPDHLSIAKKIVEQHPVSIVITGGEPLMVFNSIKSSLIFLKENGISISINTNAALVTDEIATFLSDMDISAFVSLPCSDPIICDEITSVKNSLARISKGIKILLAHNVRVTVNMVVSKRNINLIYETAKYAKEELGVSKFFASRVSKPINSDTHFIDELLTKEQFSFLLGELTRISKELNISTDTSTPIPLCNFTSNDSFQKFAYTKNCSAGKSSYSIDCYGNIKACPRDVEIYGNILTDNFSEVWDKMSDWRIDTFIPKECSSCSAKDSCNYGCRLDAFPLTKKRNSLDPMSCTENMPLKFNKKEQLIEFSLSQIFYIPKQTQYIQENGGWRISVGSKFLVITEEFKNFFSSRQQFSIEEFINEFGVDYTLSNKVVNLLHSKNIITTTK